MRLLEGIQHLTFLSEDLDRLASFYDRVFEVKKTLDLTEEGFRHIFLEVGPTTVLHPFQLLDRQALPSAPGRMFERGRLDHFGLNAASEEAFAQLRRRVMAEGAGDGLVTDMGAFLSFGFVDPDGVGHEVMWVKPEAVAAEIRPRADWTTVQMA